MGGRIFGCSLSPMPSLPPSPAALSLRAAGGNGRLRRKDLIGFPSPPGILRLAGHSCVPRPSPKPKTSGQAPWKARGPRKTTSYSIAKETRGAGAPAGLPPQSGGCLPLLPALLYHLLPASPNRSASLANPLHFAGGARVGVRLEGCARSALQPESPLPGREL